jgi:hypothetical protein
MEKRCGLGEEADEMELIKIRTDIYEEILGASHIHSKLALYTIRIKGKKLVLA